jgi:hypothetical protein
MGLNRTAFEPWAGEGHWASARGAVAGPVLPHPAYRRTAVAEAADRPSCIATTYTRSDDSS